MDNNVDLSPVLIEEFDHWIKIACFEAFQALYAPEYERAAHQDMADMANVQAARIAARLQEGHA
jgi:hypothetical protein